MNYKETLLMPETSFQMRGNLPENEKLQREKWNEINLYDKKIKARHHSFYMMDHHMLMEIFISVML